MSAGCSRGVRAMIPLLTTLYTNDRSTTPGQSINSIWLTTRKSSLDTTVVRRRGSPVDRPGRSAHKLGVDWIRRDYDNSVFWLFTQCCPGVCRSSMERQWKIKKSSAGVIFWCAHSTSVTWKTCAFFCSSNSWRLISVVVSGSLGSLLFVFFCWFHLRCVYARRRVGVSRHAGFHQGNNKRTNSMHIHRLVIRRFESRSGQATMGKEFTHICSG